MRRVLLVRHGETDWNRAGRFQGHTDVALNEAGRAQARAVAKGIAAHLSSATAIAAIGASDLVRARETAEIVAASLGHALACVDPGLRERSYGCFEGLTREECASRFPEEWAAHQRARVDPPGAEPFAAVGARVVGAVARIAEAHAEVGEAVVLVSHGGAIRAFLHAACALHVPPIPNTAIYEVAYVERAFRDPRLIATSSE